MNLKYDENLAAVLADVPLEGGGKAFSEADVKRIMEGKDAMKQMTERKTKEVCEQGAFGAPWLWVTNSKGESEAFFGSDR